MKRSGFYFILMVLICIGSPWNAWGGIPESRMYDSIKIRHFSAGKKVIPVVCDIGEWRIVDIKLPDLVVENRGRQSVIIGHIDALGRDDQGVVASVRLKPEELTTAVRKTALGLKQKQNLPALQLAFGDVVLPAGKIAESRKIDAGESAILTLSKIAYLHYVGHSRVESMDLEIQIWNGKRFSVLQYPVKLTHYEAKGKYIFPLKGDTRTAFVPLSYIHHRGSHSQEFAFDVVGAAQQGADFTEISVPNPKTLSDFSIWGREVLAVGNGTVADLGDRFPEKQMRDPAVYGRPGYVQRLVTALIGRIGFTNAVAGNYIVIDHHNGEFSVYCHLQEGSLLVKQGDKVKRGQVIARVGNTGNSGAPHLHFQIMDSKEFTKANGLPVMFENMPPSVIVAGFPVRANTIGFSDNIYNTIK